jgi:hypothetical protein
MDGDEVNEGAHGKIFKTPFGVVKIGKRRSKTLDTVTQRRIHRFAETVLSDPKYTTLRVPRLSTDLTRYEMELVNTRLEIWQATEKSLVQELICFWSEMWSLGFALYDFELYQQPDGRVVVLDFDATGFRMKKIDGSESVHNQGKNIAACDFFLHPCFPPDFEKYLLHLRLPIGKRNI